MAFSIRTSTLMLLYLATFAGLSNGVFISGVTDARWNGIVAYFSVPREKIAAKLAEIQSSSSSCSDAGELTLPYPPVLQDLIGDEDHVVAVSFGRLEATSAHHSLTEDLLDSYATEADTVQFYIPFLTGKDETAVPTYKLALNSFVSTDKPFFQPNVAIPTEQVESISISDTGLVVRNGSDVLSISLTVPSFKSCAVPDTVTEEEIEGYHREYTLSHLVKPNQALCSEGSTADLHVCVVRELPRMCQFWRHRKLQECEVGETLLDTISGKFKDISLLSGDEGAAVVSIAITGDFGIGVASPCV